MAMRVGGLRALRLGRLGQVAAARPAFAAAPARQVETVAGIDTEAPNLNLPFAQRGLPTTKTFYGQETTFNTFSSGSVEVRPK